MKWLFNVLRNIICFFLPREEQFFDLFIEMLTVIKNSIEIIKQAKTDTVQIVEKEIDVAEDRSDNLEFTIQQKLKSSITTPPQLNREVILEIASTIDNVMDALESVSKRYQSGGGEIINYLNQGFDEHRQMLDRLSEAAELSLEIMKDFSKNRIDANDSRLKRMHDIENEIDTLHIKCITEKLYHSQLNGRNIVIMQVVGKIEGAADEMQRLAKIIQGVLVSA